jgi:hypothetical protein
MDQPMPSTESAGEPLLSAHFHLVYSLPLAPGEQQQVVIEEQTTTLAVQDTEAVFGAASDQASSLSDSSTQATFNAAFQQSAQGGCNFNTSSQSGSLTAGGG